MATQKKKWLKWEFWPFWLFYFPVYIQYLRLSAKAGSMGFFAAANPLMKYGGMSNYSKYNVLKEIDKEYIPKTILLTYPYRLEEVSKLGFQYPLIAKPDIGERGTGVEKIDTEEDLKNYLNKAFQQDIIIQDYCDYPIELGVMYHRIPDTAKGKITSVVRKEVLTVEGNGSDTLEQLILTGERTYYHRDMLSEEYGEELADILPIGEKRQLSTIGNHIRGATFYNANQLINDQLEEVFDRIAIPIEGFYFGRFDFKVASIEDLYKGKTIQIVELNGANSEPTHIYDPEMPLMKAYKAMFSHWKALYEVSKANHKKGVAYCSFFKLAKDMRGKRKKREKALASLVA